MIDSKDLRIGNCYLTGLEVKGSRGAKLNMNENRVIKLTLKHIEVLAWDNSLINFLYPIKLSPEILVQIATKFNGFDIAYFNDRFTIRHIGEWGWHTIDNSGHIDKHVGYLHDLQNIYYYENNKQELPIDINTLKI